MSSRSARVVAREEGGDRVDGRVRRAAVHLDPVAGGENHGLAEPRLLAHAGQGLGQRLLREGQGLPHRDGRRLVVEADDDDHRAATATAGTSVAQANVKTTTAKPAIASQAARRPPQPAAPARDAGWPRR